MQKSILVARKILAFLLTWVLYVSLLGDSGFAKPPAHDPTDQASDISRIRSRVTALRPGTLIEVRFISREKVQARLTEIDADGFTLRMQGSPAIERRVKFSEIKSVKAVQSKRGRVITWIVAGVLVGVVVTALAILLKEKSNE